MTPEQLKASILQYAIQGKLVEQLPSDESADILHHNLIEKKQNLVKKGISKKSKTLVPITDDEKLFEIPDTWQWIKIGEIASLITKGTTPRGGNISYLDAGIGFLRAENVAGFDQLDKDNLKYIDEETHTGFLKRSILEANDILITIAGTLGRTAIVREEDLPLNANQAVSMIRLADPDAINLTYVVYALNSPEIQRYLKKQKKVTAIPNLTLEIIENCLLPLPPLSEQHRIVAKIEELLPYVDRYTAAYEKLEQFKAKFPEDMKQSILQYAIQGKLVEQRPKEGTGEELYRQIQKEKQLLIKEGKLKKTRALPTIMDEEVPYDFPASWKVCYIDDIAFVTKLAGFEYTKYIADNLVPTGIPLFKGKNVQNGKLVLSFESYIPESVSDELPRSQITKKCLLTPYVGTIGNIAVFDGSFKAHLGSNVGKIELLNPDTQTFILEEYVLWYLKSTYGYAELTKYKKATAQESISIDAIRNVVIAIPPLEEQRRIVAKIEELLPYCDKLK